MTTPLAAAISCRGLCFSYPDRADVLRDVDLAVAEGERLGVIGPNGAGKTTLFHIVCGLLAPQAGKVEILGAPPRVGRFNPQAALVFQDSDDQLFCPTVAEDVAFGPGNMGLTNEEIDERVRHALATVGAGELAGRPVHHLSGGEKRIVSLAGALAMRPRIILFDEPSSGLDSRNRRRLIDLLGEMQQTLVIASHDLELLLETCDRAILVDTGTIVADGATREVMSDAALMAAHGQEVPHSLIPHAHGALHARGSG